MIVHRPGRKFRIAYIGWVGQDNIGDELGPILFRRRFFELHPGLEPEVEIVLERDRWGDADAAVACLGTLLNPFAYGVGWMELFERAAGRGPLVGIGLGAITRGWEEWPVTAGYRARCVRWFDALGVRGHITAGLLRLGEASISGDSVFGLEWAPPGVEEAPSGGGRPRVAVNVGDALEPLRTARGDSLVELVGAACRELAGRYDLLLFSMGARDDAAIRSIGEAVGPAARCTFERDPFLLAAQLQRCDAGLTTKCHASGLMYAVGRPTVNVVYASKCEDMATVLGDRVRRSVLPMAGVTAGALVEAVDALVAEAPAARRDLLVDAARARAAWDAHFRAGMVPIAQAVSGSYRNAKRARPLGLALQAVPAYSLAAARRVVRRARRQLGAGA